MPSQRDIKIKVCGIVTVEDARLVAEAGADYIGVIIEIDSSPRRLSIEQARPICEQSSLPVVALFFNWEADSIQRAIEILHPHAVQLLGQESASLVRTLKKGPGKSKIALPPAPAGMERTDAPGAPVRTFHPPR